MKTIRIWTKSLLWNEAAAKMWVRIISVVLVALGAAVIVGWLAHIDFLKGVIPGSSTMKPNTALSFLLVGLSLFLIQAMPSNAYTKVAQVCAGLISLIGLLTLTEIVLNVNFGLDGFLPRILGQNMDAVDLRMSGATAFGFSLLGLALILLLNSRRYDLMQFLALIVISIGLIALAGYLFEVDGARNFFTPFNTVAIHTALAFFASGLTILLISSQQGLLTVITQDYLGGLMARRLLPATLLVPLIIGRLALQGQYLGYYDNEFGVALFAVGNIIVLTVVVWWTARALNAVDVEHQRARARLQRYGQRMEILHNIDQGIIASRDTWELAEATFKELRLLIPCQRIGLNIVDTTTHELVVYAANSDHAPLSIDRTPLLPIMLDGFNSVDHSRLIDDLRLVQDQVPLASAYLEQGLLALFQVQLVHDGAVQGLVTLSSNKPGFFTPEYREIAIEVSNQVAIAIQQMHLSEALRKANEKLEQRVTERTAQLNAAKEQVEGILNNSLDAILLTDVNLAIQRANPAYEKLLSYSLDDRTQISLLDVVHEDDRQKVTSNVQNALSGNSNNRVEARALRHDGSVIDVELNISHIEADGFVSNIHDITNRKRYERQMLYHAGIQNAVADAVIVTDLEFRIQSWNKAAEHMYGWREDEAIGKRISDLLQTEVNTQQVTDDSRQIIFEQGHWSGEITQHRKDGSPIYVLISTVLFKDAAGVPFGVLSVNHDITERKRAEEALRTALEHEKEVGEMKTRFISIASHEFRTPLSAILLTTGALKLYRDKMQPEQIDERLDKIHQQVTHMTAILEDVLQSARMQDNYVDFRPALENLNAICRDIVQEFAERQEFTNRIQYQSDIPDLRSTFDSRLMRQVIINLLSNALKYSPHDKPVHINLTQKYEAMVLEVSDQGIGIPPADLKNIFEPFYRAENVGNVSGTGLGMSITKRIVDMHDGSIVVTSEPNQGTTFTVTIPIH